MNLTTAERSALAVQRQVANAHIAEVLQARGNFFEQEFEGFLIGLGGVDIDRAQAGKKEMQARQGHEHQVVQRQPRQGFQLGAAPLHALGHKTFLRRQHRVGIGQGANAPEQALGL